MKDIISARPPSRFSRWQNSQALHINAVEKFETLTYVATGFAHTQLLGSCRGGAIRRAHFDFMPKVAIRRARAWPFKWCDLSPLAIAQARDPCGTRLHITLPLPESLYTIDLWFLKYIPYSWCILSSSCSFTEAVLSRLNFWKCQTRSTFWWWSRRHKSNLPWKKRTRRHDQVVTGR